MLLGCCPDPADAPSSPFLRALSSLLFIEDGWSLFIHSSPAGLLPSPLTVFLSVPSGALVASPASPACSAAESLTLPAAVLLRVL